MIHILFLPPFFNVKTFGVIPHVINYEFLSNPDYLCENVLLDFRGQFPCSCTGF